MWNRNVADSVRLDDTWLLGGDQNVSGLWEGHCDRHQNPISINGRSHGQVGSGNHTGADHSDSDRIYYVWDHQCSHG